MRQLLSFLLLAAPIWAYVDDVVDYTKYGVLSAIPSSTDQVNLLKSLEVEQSISLKLDFWGKILPNEVVNIGIPNENLDEVRQLLSSYDILNYVKINNMQVLIDEEKQENAMQYSSYLRASSFAFDQYHRYEEISSYLKNLAQENPDLVQTTSLGNTLENREILSVRVGLNSNGQKPVILIDSGIHAREWVAPATTLYMINELVSKRSTDSTIANLLSKFDWHFVPVVNPDGYAYTWTSNRMWRKNRSRSSNGCYGADPNRNFAVGFGGASTSTNPCSDIYPGTSAFSEAESRAIKQLTETHNGKISATLTLHSFGQMWMSPWGYISQHPTEYNAMVSAARTATTALRSLYGTSYAVGSVYEVIYPTGGGSSDWQYQTTRCPYAYAVELRDKGAYGFQLPRNYILPTAQETWAGVKALAGVI